MQSTVADLLAQDRPSFSFEFFPPKTDEGEAVLWQAIGELEPLNPTFVDVTYGAGGGTRDRTLAVVKRIAAETSLNVVAHLTCVGATVEELRATAQDFADAGIRNILALRGDMPGGPQATWEGTQGGLRHAEDLVALLHEVGDFCVGVAAHPEAHPESADLDTDAKFLAQKCTAGADFAITQFFFEAEHYFRLVERAGGFGCAIPIIPGIMPVTNIAQVQRMAALSGAEFPRWLAERLESVADDPEAVRAVGVEAAGELAEALLEGGAPGIHFYTLNRSTATREIYARFRPDLR